MGEPDIVIKRSLQEVFSILVGLLLLILSIYYFYDDANTTKMDYYDIASNILRIITSFEIIIFGLSQKRFYEKGLLMLYKFIPWDEVRNYKFEGVEMNILNLTLKNWKHLTKKIQFKVQKKQHEEVEKYLASKGIVEKISTKQISNCNEVEINNKPIKSKLTLFLIPIIIALLFGLVIIGVIGSK